MNTNKRDNVLKLYNADTFDFDCSLPVSTVDTILQDMDCAQLFHGKLKVLTNAEMWQVLRNGTVYAYCKISGRSGFLPITLEALKLLELCEIDKKCSLIFTPILEELT